MRLSVTKSSRLSFFCNIPAYCDRTDGISISNTFTYSDDIRLDVIVLVSEPFPCATDTCCDFIGNQNTTMLFNSLGNIFYELFGWEFNKPSATSTWLEDKTTYFFKWDRI